MLCWKVSMTMLISATATRSDIDETNRHNPAHFYPANRRHGCGLRSGQGIVSGRGI
jgi:hypothetical protein